MPTKRKADTKTAFKAKKANTETSKHDDLSATKGPDPVRESETAQQVAQTDNLESKVVSSEDAKTSSKAKIKNVKVGDSIPSITLKDHAGEDVDLADIAKDSGIVLFSYPAASTPGCTSQVR